VRLAVTSAGGDKDLLRLDSADIVASPKSRDDGELEGEDNNELNKNTSWSYMLHRTLK
jgi:hypothetical protein